MPILWSKLLNVSFQDIANRDSKYTRETGMLQYDRNILQDQYNRSTDDEEKAKLAKRNYREYEKET